MSGGLRMVCGLLSCVPVVPVEGIGLRGTGYPKVRSIQGMAEWMLRSESPNLRISPFSTVPHQGLAGLERMFDILRSRHRNSHASGMELTSDGHLATCGSLRCSHFMNFSKVNTPMLHGGKDPLLLRLSNVLRVLWWFSSVPTIYNLQARNRCRICRPLDQHKRLLLWFTFCIVCWHLHVNESPIGINCHSDVHGLQTVPFGNDARSVKEVAPRKESATWSSAPSTARGSPWFKQIWSFRALRIFRRKKLQVSIRV